MGPASGSACGEVNTAVDLLPPSTAHKGGERVVEIRPVCSGGRGWKPDLRTWRQGRTSSRLSEVSQANATNEGKNTRGSRSDPECDGTRLLPAIDRGGGRPPSLKEMEVNRRALFRGALSAAATAALAPVVALLPSEVAAAPSAAGFRINSDADGHWVEARYLVSADGRTRINLEAGTITLAA